MYRVEIIDTTFVKTIEDYWHAQNEAEIKHFEKLKDAESALGIKFHRQRAGYSATAGNTDYIAYRI